MIDLLIIADDFTGAMDTAVKFSRYTAGVRVFREVPPAEEFLDPGIHVAAVNTASRHMGREQAKQIVSRIVYDAWMLGIPRILIKTDSVMRGNIGASFEGALEYTEEHRIYFVPALPEQGRFTRKGIQMFGNVPIHETEFGKDPFEPVRTSDVREIIGGQTGIPVRTVDIEDAENADKEDRKEKQILVYDCGSEAEMERIAKAVYAVGVFRIYAGCAGFAKALAERMYASEKERTRGGVSSPILFLCGTLNPVTRNQIRYGKQNLNYEVMELSLTEQYSYGRRFPETKAGGAFLDRAYRFLSGGRSVAVCSNPETDVCRILPYMLDPLSSEERRLYVAGLLADLLAALLEKEVRCTVLVSGGDLMMEVLNRMGITFLDPVCEALPGVVVSKIAYREKTIGIMSKSGGFGREQLLGELIR